MKSLKDDFDSSNKTPRTLYHVYQKLHQLRELIAGDDCPNAARLAEKMEISLRTVKRYLDHLRECGAPLGNNRKRGGYFFTDPFWQLPAMRLSEGDLLAFFIAEQALKSAGQTSEAAQLRKSLSRLASFLPDEVSINLTALAAGVSFQNLPFAAAPPETLALLTESSVNQQTITFDYYSPHNREHTSRKANILLLHNFIGDWFAVCYDKMKADTRDFHVGRMSNVKLTGETFKMPISLIKEVHQEYFEPKIEEFQNSSVWSLSNAYTSAFKRLNPVSRYEQTARVGRLISETFIPL